MPLIKLQVSVPVPDERRPALLKAASRILSDVSGKPEKYVMVMLDQGSACMAGKPVPSAFADVRGIGGFNKDVNTTLSRQICDLLEKELKIEPANVYLNFTDVAAQNWGWNSGTFG